MASGPNRSRISAFSTVDWASTDTGQLGAEAAAVGLLHEEHHAVATRVRVQDATQVRRAVLVEGARGHPQLQVARPRIFLVKLQRLQLEGHDLVTAVTALELALDFAMTSSWMTSAKSSYLKQMHSMEPVVSSRVNVAIFVPRFVSFVATFEIMPTNTPFLISLVCSESMPMS